MRIVNFKEFCDLPDGVIFSYYEPCIVTGLFRRERVYRHEDDYFPGNSRIGHVKGQAFDYLEISLIAGPEIPSRENPSPHPDSLEVNKNSGRWGCYEYDQLYAIYEPADIQTIVDLLTIKESHGEVTPATT